jgi:hypothetical protein
MTDILESGLCTITTDDSSHEYFGNNIVLKAKPISAASLINDWPRGKCKWKVVLVLN